jgi:5-methylcytosine-specific restriction enzyme subunit McrC
MDTTIPIHNLYHLLCYAWDRLEELDLVDVAADTPPRDTLNLLGRVLCNGVRALIRRGFERGYLERQDALSGLRGKILIASTARRLLPRYGRAECAYDELEYDTPANRVLLATLSTLARSALVEADLRHELAGLLRHFREVRPIRATVADCRRVIIHRNNRHYGFLIDICALVIGRLLPDETGADTRFRDFSRDHQAMARLFEDFVRQFYIHHAAECGVTEPKRRDIAWSGSPADPTSARLWPAMQTDLCLRRADAPPLVIDCKFYHDPLKESPHDGQGLSSANLYQIFSYTLNIAAQPGWETSEGLLLYAENGTPFDLAHTACGHRLRAASLDLNQPWPAIHSRLVEIALR